MDLTVDINCNNPECSVGLPFGPKRHTGAVFTKSAGML